MSRPVLKDDSVVSGKNETLIESQAHHIVYCHKIPNDVCPVIQSQIRRAITGILETSLSMDFLSFVVQCHGTFHSGIALSDDEVRVMIVHHTNVAETDIINSLKKCSLFCFLCSSQGCHRFFINRVAAGYSSRWLWEQVGTRDGPESLQFALEIIPLSHPFYHQVYFPRKRLANVSRFQDDSLGSAYPDRIDINVVPDRKRPIIYRQNLSRFLRAHHRFPFLQDTAILLRLMARNQGIESSKAGYISPLLLQLFVLRYSEEIYKGQNSYSAQVNYFNLAKYVCKRVCEFDYGKFIWGIDGDKPLHGDCLRVSHPVYPGYCMTPNISSQSTKLVMRVFSRMSKARSVEEFIGSSNASTENGLNRLPLKKIK
jgi:hypothetical protein